MKKLNLAIALTLVLGFTMNGQLVKEMFNTAAQPGAYTTYRPYGMQDVAWFVAQTPYGSISTPPTNPGAYVRAVSQDASGTTWFNPHPTTIPNAGWITYPNKCNTAIPAYHGCLNNPPVSWGVDQWYKISFYLCCDEDFCLNLDMWADNRIHEIYVNTTSNSGSGYWSNPGPGSGSPGTFQGYLYNEKVSRNVCGFHKGLNYMIIHVTSYDPDNSSDYAALLVNATSISECNGIIYNQLEEEDKDGTDGRKAALNTKKSSEAGISVLSQNVPNPFAESTLITYTLPDNFTKAQISFRGIDGALIKSVELTQKGKGSLNISADELSQGIYSYQLIVDGKVIDSKRMLVAKK